MDLTPRVRGMTVDVPVYKTGRRWVSPHYHSRSRDDRRAQNLRDSQRTVSRESRTYAMGKPGVTVRNSEAIQVTGERRENAKQRRAKIKVQRMQERRMPCLVPDCYELNAYPNAHAFLWQLPNLFEEGRDFDETTCRREATLM